MANLPARRIKGTLLTNGKTRKIRTAMRLLRNQEYDRITTAVIRTVEDNAPAPVKNLNLGYRLRTMLGRVPGTANTGQAAFDPLNVQPRHSTSPAHRIHDPLPLAAVILDEFSHAAFSPALPTVAITPENWKTIFTGRQAPQWLFVESAWRGNAGAWAKRLSTPGVLDPEIAALTTYCREHNIPTVFWNKEDPVHFADFLHTAQAFDYVFTTDADKIPAYHAAGCASVHLLPFAAQPFIHNPVRNSAPAHKHPNLNRPNAQFQAGDIAFAGTYFQDKYPERREQMDLLLGAASALANTAGLRLSIFSRYGSADRRYRFPHRFQPFVVGSLEHNKMLGALQQHKVFLNVNSVTDSASMCARRVFEFPAAGATIVSTASPAIAAFFSEEQIPIAHDEAQAASLLRGLVGNPLVRDVQLHQTQRLIWQQHTYQHRLDTILQVIAKDAPNFAVQQDWTATPAVSCVCPTNRPEQLPHVLAQLRQQVNVDLEAIILAHGWDAAEDCSEARAAALSAEYGFPISFVVCDAEQTLGENLNRGVAAAAHPIIAKIDDDDFYLPHYLYDQTRALMYSGADVVGKRANFAYLEGLDVLVLRQPTAEHCYVDFLAGPTLVGWRQTFEDVPFEARTTGEDSAFLRSLIAAGRTIYAADRFNFIQVRGRKHAGSSHTWDVSDWHFLADGQVQTRGLHFSHVEA